jgi:hypothetical protein
MLNVFDEFTHKCLAVRVVRKLKTERRDLHAQPAGQSLDLGHLQPGLGMGNITRTGTISHKSSSRLPARSDCWLDNPVTLPPGRAKFLITSPPTGSIPIGKTIGMTDVGFRAQAVQCPELTAR